MGQQRGPVGQRGDPNGRSTDPKGCSADAKGCSAGPKGCFAEGARACWRGTKAGADGCGRRLVEGPCCARLISGACFGLAASAITVVVLARLFMVDDLASFCVASDWNWTPTVSLNVTGYRVLPADCNRELVDSCYSGAVEFSFAAGMRACSYDFRGTYTATADLLKDMEAMFALHTVWNGRARKDQCTPLMQQLVCIVSYEIVLAAVTSAGILLGSCLGLVSLICLPRPLRSPAASPAALADRAHAANIV